MATLGDCDSIQTNLEESSGMAPAERARRQSKNNSNGNEIGLSSHDKGHGTCQGSSRVQPVYLQIRDR